ncbi:MAG: 30S ribosomal protein S12 methylthiotransferase RimO [[Clostridium] aminophilum]|uniref:30S ribosomal protein S12 methylthiotransferase RimO n=1 Tax=[Clostridium] aminophilum TaxID=1526 RepID=UPI0026EB1617|nr:30S ribosomal protein S12 methylthiotransferase RimO [[Clostridium] aminophilum]MDD6197198.1 30S ribosomal protein S12 methylthiotransferase RimO [[Clostridium] aminophilum]
MKILCVSLGCDKNLVDSEMMLGLSTKDGYQLTDDDQEADVVIVNTCAFIDAAKEESINTILDMARLKEDAKCQALVVTGCMAERYKKEVLKEIPEVDAVLGTTTYGEISKVLRRLQNGEKHIEVYEDLSRMPEDDHRVFTTGSAYSYLKIAEGCNKRCTYCIIPYLRGPYRSEPMVKLISQAKKIAENGVKELILVAQETTLYGTDLSQKKMLPTLLRELGRIEGLEWIRLQYCYPEEITDEIIEAIAKEPKVCHYIDLPIQHASDRILKRMGRRTTHDEIISRIHRIRELIPDVALRTTLISGFPGETEEDHQILMDFVREVEFDRLGVFTYSQEEDTPAAAMEDQIPEEVKERRRDEIMALQQEIAFRKEKEKIGSEMRVMVEGRMPEEDYGFGVYTCRTYMDAPNIDSQIFVHSERDLMSGDFIRCTVTDSDGYDLIGEEIADWDDEEEE